MDITIVGGGIMGLCAAWALQTHGCTVTVMEQGPLPNPRGSSVDSQRVIRRPYGPAIGYMRMVGQAYRAWDDLWADLGRQLFVRKGTLIGSRGGAGWVTESVRAMRADNLPFETLTCADMESRRPHIRTDGFEGGYFLADGGLLLADQIVGALADYVITRGATILTETSVASVDTARAMVVLDRGDEVRADAVIIAAGPWVARLRPDFATRAKPSRQILVYLEPPPSLAVSWDDGPMLLDVSLSGGAFLLPPAGGAPGKIGIHTLTPSGDPDDDRQVTQADIEANLRAAREILRASADYRVARTLACYYTVAADERFIVEPLDGQDRAWVMTGFSGHGFKFAPVMGRAVADGILGHRPAAEVSTYCAGTVLAA